MVINCETGIQTQNLQNCRQEGTLLSTMKNQRTRRSADTGGTDGPGSKRVSLNKSHPIIMFKGRGNSQARSITQKMEPLNNVNKILSVMYTKGGMETYSGNESTQAA